MEKSNLLKSAALLKSFAQPIVSKLHLLTVISVVDAILMCSFYALVSFAICPLVIKGDSSSFYLIYYSFFIIAIRFVIHLIEGAIKSKISVNIEEQIRKDIINKITSTGPLSSQRKSSLASVLIEGIEEIVPYFTLYLSSAKFAMSIPCVILVAVFMVSTLSGIILLILCPLIPIFMILIGKGAERLNQRQWVRITRISTHFKEAMQRLTLIKLFNLQKSEEEIISRMSKRWRVETMQILRIAFLSALVLEFFSTVGVALCAITLGFAVYEKGFDFTLALYVLMLAPEFFLPLRTLGQNYHIRMRSLGAISAVVDLFEQEDLKTFEDKADIKKVKFNIRFENVSVLYPNKRVGIEHKSFEIKENCITALVGQSGCGKSTILQVLSGLLDVNEGHVYIDNHDIQDFSKKSLLQRISYIPQNPHLFFGTIKENLLIAKGDASDEQLYDALDMVGAKYILDRFCDGLNHRISDGNKGISGGEARLIALARTILKNTDVILLDEPTASLDADSERLFLNAITKISKGKTLIMVAHRQELIDMADNIIDVPRANA